jgi:hypothetical protein
VRFSVDSLITHTTHNFEITGDLVNEVENARVYAGFHYRHSVIQGKVLGTNAPFDAALLQAIERYIRLTKLKRGR